MREKSREERFDEVFQLVLIVVALSFDILWTTGRTPIAEIAVFIYALFFWAFGNLKGGIWEYPCKLGSFNLSIMLLTNFYVLSIFDSLAILLLWEIVVGVIVLPAICFTITVVLILYLKETIDFKITGYIVIGITFGYMIGFYSVMTLP
ncbi:MAG: hypothetical protein ACFFDQ_01320 [Candidatus Thorarchaeota archaeon]